MLAGNKLQDLPPSIARCGALELIRISANQLRVFPDVVLGLPKLAWIAFSGNPFCLAFPENASLPKASFEDVSCGKILGAGASGIITQAGWRHPPTEIENPQNPIAVKTFKGDVTSDGYPRDELAASLAAEAHAGLIPILAKLSSSGQTGLVMDLVDPSFTNLGEPPNFETCTRDVFSHDLSLSADHILSMAQSLSRTVVHLRGRNICHGDLYAHNILVNAEGDLLLGDFGAASHYGSLSAVQASALEAIEVRAFGCFLEDILGLIKPETRAASFIPALENLAEACLQTNAAERPRFEDIQARLGGL